MQNARATDNSDQIASLVDWWKMAGVDYVVEDAPSSWLKPVETAAPKAEINKASSIDKEVPVSEPAEFVTEWPDNLDELRKQISDQTRLPGNCYGGKSAISVGNINAKLMIILDLPEIKEIESGRFCEGPTGALIRNIIAAMGYKFDDCYITALATTRPATGQLPDGDETSLTGFMLHQIKIVDPAAVLIFGSSACRALLGAELMESHGRLRDINHYVGKKAALTTFHPRTLLARPVLKAQAWKDLQMLAKKDAL